MDFEVTNLMGDHLGQIVIGQVTTHEYEFELTIERAMRTVQLMVVRLMWSDGEPEVFCRPASNLDCCQGIRQ
jgi:hypothetical protein